MPTARIACPFCRTALVSAGLAAGARVRCPRCRAAFTVRAEDLRAAALPASPPTSPAATAAASPSSAAWLLVLGGGGAALLLLCAATVGAVLLLAGKRAPQIAAAPTPIPSPAERPRSPAAEPTTPPTKPPASPDADVHRKPPKDEPLPLKPPPVPEAPPPLNDPPPLNNPPPDLKPDPPAAPKPTELPPAMQNKVNKAIERGVAFLKKAQNGDGSWPYPLADIDGANGGLVGPTALPGLTLLECGVPADDAHVVKAAAFVRKKAPGAQSPYETYDLALAILFLDRLGDPKDEPLLQSMALRLIAGQTRSGGWTYQCPALSVREEAALLTALRKTRPTSVLELIAPKSGDKPTSEKPGVPPPPQGDDAREAKKALDALPAELRNVPALRPPARDEDFTNEADVTDNSNTQFAILGLWTARRHDVPMERALALIDRRFRLSQEENGGWGYNLGTGVVTPAMTAAGLLGLAVGHGVTADLKGDAAPKEAAEDAAVEKGMKELGHQIGTGDAGSPLGNILGALLGAKDDGSPAPPDLYFFWSVERVGVLYGRRSIGGQEWYPWGAEKLVAAQTGDGSWPQTYGGAADTSFALLFLKRANLVRDLSAKLELLTEVKPKGPRP